MHIDMVHDGTDLVEGLVLQVRGPENAYRGLRISGMEGDVEYDENRQLARVRLPGILPGTTRLVLVWSR